MASRVQLPNSRLKRRKRVRRTRLAIALGVLLLFVAAGVVGLSWIPGIRIHEVEVVGAKTLGTENVEQYVSEKLEGRKFFVLPANNVFFYPKKEIIERLRNEYPVLKEAYIRAKNFEAIEVTLIEREPKALWCGEARDETGGCRLMDETGFIYSADLGLTLPSYVRYTGIASSTSGYSGAVEPKQFLTPEEFKALSALVAALAQNQSQTEVISVDVDTHRDVRVVFGNAFMLLFSLTDAGGDVYERFTLALGAEPFKDKNLSGFEYLDLRFGDKLYYKER
jgi:cell division septal protein FtsQ